GKPAKRGMRGPRGLRRGRSGNRNSDSRSETPDGGDTVSATELAPQSPDVPRDRGEAAADGNNAARAGRKRDNGRKRNGGKRTQPSGDARSKRKVGGADELFAMLATGEFDTLVEDKEGGRPQPSRNVRRDLTAEDD